MLPTPAPPETQPDAVIISKQPTDLQHALFAATVQRYEDQIGVQNLEEAVLDEQLALRLVNLHGRLSENLPSHNRSDQMREQPPTLEDFRRLLAELEAIDTDLKQARKVTKRAREARKKAKSGW